MKKKKRGMPLDQPIEKAPEHLSEKMTIQEAYELIEGNRRQRSQACQVAIEQALQEFGCQLDVKLYKQGNTFLSQVVILAP